MATKTADYDDDELDCNVLSIQSSVVYGYVGNKSATFPLQLLGFDVSTISSVQFSNHTGYGQWRGQILNAEDVGDLFEGLRMNNLLNFSHVLTGYIGKVSFLEKVGETITEMKNKNPNLVFVCDPVMGDNGKFYVPKELMPIYRDQIVTQADIVTPNQFELEQLAGMEISSESDAFTAARKLHDRGCKVVVLSSSTLGAENTLQCLASTAANGRRECYRLDIPQLAAKFSGTGDLFAASLLAWMQKDRDLKVALEKTVSTVQAVIKKTLAYAKKTDRSDIPLPAQMELRLIQSKRIIENPLVEIHAEEVSLQS